MVGEVILQVCGWKKGKTVIALESELADLVEVWTVVTIRPVMPEHADTTHRTIFTAVILATFQYMLYLIHVASNLGNDSPRFFNITTNIQVSSGRSS